MYKCTSLEEARKKRDEIIREYQDVAEAAMACLDEGFESAMVVTSFPIKLRVRLRTSNIVERLNRELKRRSNVIGVFPNDASVLRLMGSVLMEIHQGLQDNDSVMSPKTYDNILHSELPAQLVRLAREQRALLAA